MAINKKNAAIDTALISFIALSLLSCDYGAEDLFGREDEVYSRSSSIYEATPPLSSSIPSAYTFIVISDVHFGRKSRDNDEHDESIAPFTSYLTGEGEKDRPLFIVCLGDVAEHGEKEEMEEYASWVKGIEEIPNEYGKIKVYTALGNHDLYNDGFNAWKSIVFPVSLYRFDIGTFSYYFIDSASGAIGRKQMNAIEDALKKDKKYKIVFSHFPLYADGKFYFCLQNTAERNRLISLFAKNKVIAVMTGHTHEKHTDNFGSFTEYNIPSLLDKRKWALVKVNGKDISCTIMD